MEDSIDTEKEEMMMDHMKKERRMFTQNLFTHRMNAKKKRCSCLCIQDYY
jgi:hypothetical protein